MSVLKKDSKPANNKILIYVNLVLIIMIIRILKNISLFQHIDLIGHARQSSNYLSETHKFSEFMEHRMNDLSERKLTKTDV